MRRESLLSLPLVLLLLHLILPHHLPHHLPPTFHALSTHPSPPTLESLLINLPNPARTPLHATYKKLASCRIDLPALRKALSHHSAAPRHRLVVCLTRPLTSDYLHFVRVLSRRLGDPYITTTDAHVLARLARHNVTPILPASPDEALAAMAAAENLLIASGIPCAFGARVARGVVYYTKEFHDFVSLHGYEWLPDNAARLDGYDRSFRAALAALGSVEETCCRFRNGVCYPLMERCRAVVMGELKEGVGCKMVNVCRKGPCPAWAAVVKAGVPDVLVMDIAGGEFEVLKEVCATRRLPRQIVLRMRVWADRDLGDGWNRAKQGWMVKRDVVIDVVSRLRKSGYRLVHRVDDPGCEWCAFVTFLRV